MHEVVLDAFATVRRQLEAPLSADAKRREVVARFPDGPPTQSTVDKEARFTDGTSMSAWWGKLKAAGRLDEAALAALPEAYQTEYRAALAARAVPKPPNLSADAKRREAVARFPDGPPTRSTVDKEARFTDGTSMTNWWAGLKRAGRLDEAALAALPEAYQTEHRAAHAARRGRQGDDRRGKRQKLEMVGVGA